MIFEDLKDQLTEQLQQTWNQIQESSIYIELKEKYGNLSPNAQKATMIGAILFALLLVFTIPWTYMSSSSSALAQFEEQKDMIRELFRVSRASGELENAPMVITAPALQGRADGIVRGSNLQPEQIRSINIYNNSGPNASQVIPKNVLQEGVEISLAKLNLPQMVQIGEKLQGIDAGVKMVAMEISAAADDPHYFDVIYRLVSFALPAEPEKPADKKGKRGQKADED